MQTTQPNSQYTSVLTLTNTLTSNGSSAGNTTQIWQRTSAAAPSAVRPLKLSYTNGEFNGEIYEMTDSQIKDWIVRLRNRMMTTGIGKYVLQDEAPAKGKWIKKGTAFIDA